MRETLFRGKRVDNGDWVVSDSIMQTKRQNPHLWVEYEGLVEVIRETAGQYTGLTDKNGNKIFEGDIVKVKITQIEDIKTYGPYKYKVGFIAYNEDFALFTCKNNFMNFINWAFNDCEVIGNIYDNPELLKEI